MNNQAIKDLIKNSGFYDVSHKFDYNFLKSGRIDEGQIDDDYVRNFWNIARNALDALENLLDLKGD